MPSSEPDFPASIRHADRLSTAARAVLEIGPAAAYTQLVPPEGGNQAARPLLERLTPKNVLISPAASASAGACVLSALWLWHDFLDESHRLSQDIHTPEGSYWHAIMHRREGDFWNSKHWLNKCRGHAALSTMATFANDAINRVRGEKSLFGLALGEWDAHGFVDLVEAVHEQPADPRRAIVVTLQRLEWRALLEHCL